MPLRFMHGPRLRALTLHKHVTPSVDDALRLSLTSAGERLSKRSEDTTTRVVPPLAGLHAFVETFHRKAVADAKQSARREANTRCEVNVYRERIADLAKREAAAAADAAQSHTDAPTSINATAQVQQATATSLSPTSPTNTWLETHLPSAMIPSSHSPSVQRELYQQACERHSLLATETNDKVKMLRWKLSTDLPVKLTAVCRDEGKSSGDEVVLMD